MADILTPTQTLLIFALLARSGFAPQNDLGITVDAAERDALEKEGLVSTIKREHNTLWLRLEDAGWDWAKNNLTKALPPNQLVLQHVFRRLDAHLKDTGESLAELFGTPPKPGPLDPELIKSPEMPKD